MPAIAREITSAGSVRCLRRCRGSDLDLSTGDRPGRLRPLTWGNVARRCPLVAGVHP